MNKRANIGYIFGLLIVFVVGSLIVTFLVSPGSFNNFKSNVKSILPSPSINSNVISNSATQTLLDKCKISLSKCEDITRKKFGTFSVTLLDSKEINNLEEGEDFSSTWSFILSSLETAVRIEYGYENKVEFPIILLATRVSGPGGEMPVLVQCNKEGDLFRFSKMSLLCGS